MQTEDLPEPTNLAGTDPSRLDWHLRWVDDEPQPSEPNSGRSSGRFHPKKPKPPDKNSKKAENYLDPATI